MIRLYQNFWQKSGLNINNSSRGQYSANKNVMFKTSMLTSDFCDCSDAYAIVKGRKNNWDDVDKTRNKKLIFKSNAPFRSCISRINSTFIDNTEDLDIASMCYLLKHSDNYSMISGSLWNSYGDEVNDHIKKKRC